MYQKQTDCHESTSRYVYNAICWVKFEESVIKIGEVYEALWPRALVRYSLIFWGPEFQSGPGLGQAGIYVGQLQKKSTTHGKKCQNSNMFWSQKS